MTEIQHPLETASIESWPHLLGSRWTRKNASTTASKLQRTWGVGRLTACLESDSKIQIESEPVLAQCPPHLIPLPPQQAEVQVLNHTTYQRLCISNQSSNHTLYYRTCTWWRTDVTMRILFSAPSQFWHVHICNLNAAKTKSLAFNINMGTHKCSPCWNTAVCWSQQCTPAFLARDLPQGPVGVVWAANAVTISSHRRQGQVRVLEIYTSHLKSIPTPNTRKGQWESSLSVKTQFTQLFLPLRKPVTSSAEQSSE